MSLLLGGREQPASVSGLCQTARHGINGVVLPGFIATVVYPATCAGYAVLVAPADRWYFVIKLQVI